MQHRLDRRAAPQPDWVDAFEVARPTVRRMAEVEPEKVEWLWPGRLPIGQLVVLDGDPGCGKSTLTLDLAAHFSAGTVLPDGSVPEQHPNTDVAGSTGKAPQPTTPMTWSRSVGTTTTPVTPPTYSHKSLRTDRARSVTSSKKWAEQASQSTRRSGQRSASGCCPGKSAHPANPNTGNGSPPTKATKTHTTPRLCDDS